MSGHRWKITGGFAVVLIALMTWLVHSSEFRYRHPRAPDVHFSVTRKGAVKLASPSADSSSASATAAGEQPAPQAVVDGPEFDFGIMDPLTVGTHVFIIRNAGPGPLDLRRGSTTCKCTLSELSDGVVPPGGQAQVRLEWNTGRSREFYSHAATIHTNDPLQPSIDLRVSGMVRVQFGATREQIVFPKQSAGESVKADTTVYSQVWNGFTFTKIDTSLSGMKVDVQPADAAELQELGARSGYRITLTSPDTLPTGNFADWLRLTAEADDAQREPQTLELGVFGKVLRRLAVYGPDLQDDGVIRFGVLKPGQGAKQRLVMRVRDDEPKLPVRRITVRPDFVRVQVAPFDPSAENKGLYHLDVEVSPTAPAGNWKLERHGELRIEFDHPRIAELVLELDFAVLEGSR